MKKISILLLAAALMTVVMCSCGAGGVKIDEKHFPDANFRQYVFENFDANGDWKLSEDEMSIVTEIDVGGDGIESMQGLEYFTNLQRLICGPGKFTEIDLSKNTELTFLYCSDGELSELDISNNTKLGEIQCTDNNLDELDVSDCTELTYLACSGNNLTSLDVSKNTKLGILYFSRNDISEIDISNCPNLISIGCIDTNISYLDLTNCTCESPTVYCYRDYDTANEKTYYVDSAKKHSLTIEYREDQIVQWKN